MNVEIITTGSELMLGLVLNTHPYWLSRRLADLGYDVRRHLAVADAGPEIEQAVGEALGRADLVITTGGLGPTSDDLTREHIARLLGRELREDRAVLEHLEHFFAVRRREIPARSRVQAQVPDGARVLQNAHGIAPGLVIAVEAGRFREEPGALIMLPGPPRELRPMFLEQVAPYLRETWPSGAGFVAQTFRTTGIGESTVEEMIAAPLKPLAEQGLQVGYCARLGEVDVRLVAGGPNAANLVQAGEEILRRVLGNAIFGLNDESLESVAVRLLTERGETLALAESCTGGYLAHRITNVPGASAVFLGGLVTYSNECKQAFLGVSEESLKRHGAVSEAVAREMAEGARARTGASYALSVTGIAGPSGGTEEKPVGTVYLGLAGGVETRVARRLNPYDRETFKQITAQQALEILRRELLGARE